MCGFGQRHYQPDYNHCRGRSPLTSSVTVITALLTMRLARCCLAVRCIVSVSVHRRTRVLGYHRDLRVPTVAKFSGRGRLSCRRYNIYPLLRAKRKRAAPRELLVLSRGPIEQLIWNSHHAILFPNIGAAKGNSKDY